MSNILTFSRNRNTSVEQIDDQTLKSRCRLQDTLQDAFVEITVKLPDLEITDVIWETNRTYQKNAVKADGSLKNIIGVRVGPGMLKIIKGLIGQTEESKELTFMVEECCHGIILSFTKDQLLSLTEGQIDSVELYNEMIKGNPRLFNRCAAFAKGSPLVEGMESPVGQE